MPDEEAVEVYRLTRSAAIPVWIAVGVLGLLLLAGCQPAPEEGQEETMEPALTEESVTEEPTEVHEEIPAELAAVGEHAEDTYDVVKAEEWDKAATDAEWFTTGLDDMVAVVDGQQDAKDELVARNEDLKTAIEGKDRVAAMTAANEMTKIVMDMSRTYEPAVPVEVEMMDYYGRQLQIDAAEEDMDKVNETLAQIDTVWEQLRPMVTQNATQAEAEDFEALVADLKAADTPQKVMDLSMPFLDGVDLLENIFKAP